MIFKNAQIKLAVKKKNAWVVVDLHRSKLRLWPINIRGEDTEVVQSYKYPGVPLDNITDWLQMSCTGRASADLLNVDSDMLF